MLIHKREICQKFKELSDWCRKLSGLIKPRPCLWKKKKKKKKVLQTPISGAGHSYTPAPKKLSVPRRDMNLMNWFPNVLKILVLCFCLFVCLFVCFLLLFLFCFRLCFCFLKRQTPALWDRGSVPGVGKARFNVATPTYATITCTAYVHVLLYNLQTKSI